MNVSLEVPIATVPEAVILSSGRILHLSLVAPKMVDYLRMLIILPPL